jgi:hypothetical protein
MVRKLSIVAALVLALGAASVKPAPAIVFICNCRVCAGGTGPACHGGGCPAWWAAHSSECG